MLKWRYRQVCGFLLLGWILVAGGHAQASSVRPLRVLMLYSNDRLLPAGVRLDEGMQNVLDPLRNQSSFIMYSEFLDSTRLIGPEQEENLAAYMLNRYRDYKPDVLVAVGDQSLRFFLSRRDSFYSDVPLVYGAALLDEEDKKRGFPDCAGVPIGFTVGATAQALMAMRPNTKEIVLVSGSSPFEKKLLSIALQECAYLQGRVTVRNLELPFTELEREIAQLPETSAVIFLTYFRSPAGEVYVPQRVVEALAAVSDAPIMGIADTYIGTGVLGVAVVPFETQGHNLGRVVQRVIAGESPGSIGVQSPGEPVLILDDRQVKKYGIKAIPEGAEIRYQPNSLWQQHRGAIINVGVIVAFQSSLITILLLSKARQRKTDSELRASEARFSGVFHGSPVAIGILRQKDGRIVAVNPSWEKLTGMPASSFIEHTPIEAGILSGDDVEHRFQLFLESGRSLVNFELTFQRPDGQTRSMSLTSELIPLHGESCYIVAGEDITERQEAEAAREQLGRSSRLAILGEVTASIAHEINQPLGAILSNAHAAEMQLESKVPPIGELKQILADIRHDIQRASAVITRVRNLVGHRRVRPVRFDLNHTVRETCKLIHSNSRQHGISLVQELAEELPVIYGDAGQIEQLILNLLINAIDAMKDTPVALRRIIIRTSPTEPDSVVVSVIDHGHGIPPGKIGRVFDSFFTTKEDGMGLGLALAHSIAETHGGYISAENNSEMGASFHLVLPCNSTQSTT